MMEVQKTKFDIQKRQQSAFEASVDNVKMANEAIKSSQNWLLLLGLAELSFLGAILFKNESNSYWINFLVATLLIAFSFFIVGSIGQYKHLLSSARKYDKISRAAINNYLRKGIITLDDEPKDLELPNPQIASSPIANYLIFTAYILVLLVTLAFILLICKI